MPGSEQASLVLESQLQALIVAAFRLSLALFFVMVLFLSASWGPEGEGSGEIGALPLFCVHEFPMPFPEVLWPLCNGGALSHPIFFKIATLP